VARAIFVRLVPLCLPTSTMFARTR
jgi:hypothetical protein